MSKLLTLVSALSDRHAALLIEYAKDFDLVRAARCTSIKPSEAKLIIEGVAFRRCVEQIQADRLADSSVDAKWLLDELVDNHRLARQSGKLTASNAALGLIARHTMVDAFAAEKINVNSDAEVLDRLTRGRERTAKHVSH